MESTIKNNSLTQYEEMYIDYNQVDYSNSTEDIDLPVAASHIYIDNTLEYYIDYNSRKIDL